MVILKILAVLVVAYLAFAAIFMPTSWFPEPWRTLWVPFAVLVILVGLGWVWYQRRSSMG